MNFVAPIGGWRTDVPLSQMPPTAAASLINWFPEAGFIRARNGSQPWVTGIASSVQTLMPYSGSAQKLFAAAGVGVFDVSSAGAVGAAAYTITQPYLASVNFTNSGGHWLVNVNGADTPFKFDGTTWSTTAITGPADPTKLFAVAVYRSRLWFLEKNTANLWFLPTDAILGAAQAVNLGNVMQYGGLPVAIGAWTSQTQLGILQFLCILSSEGELVVYQGSDPTNASNWSLLGTFKLGFPLGKRCFYQIGADLAVMTVDGIIPVSQAISLDPSATDQASLTKGIAPTWLATVQTVGKDTVGWQLSVYPARRMAIINVPDPTVGTYQYVMNTETRAWTLFSGMASTCWIVWNGGLYFGLSTGGVMQADAGSSDNGAPIDCLSVGAWTRLSDGLAPKSTTLIGVDAILDTNAAIFAGASFDYRATTPAALGVGSGSSSVATWDVSLWDQANWPGVAPERLIADASGLGVIFAPTVRALISGSAATPSNCMMLGGAIHVQQGAGI